MRKQEQIQLILSEVDFKRIQKVMTTLDWKWDIEGKGKVVPSVTELRDVAELCLQKVANSKDESTTFSAGGFEAEKIENTLELRFIIERVNPLSHVLNPDAKNELARKA